jgi:hypothetical protein
MREHLESVQRQTGHVDQNLLPVVCIDQSKYIYEYFTSMNVRRQYGEAGPQMITHAEMTAWANLRGVTLSVFECEALDRIERIYLDRCYKRLKREMEAKRGMKP